MSSTPVGKAQQQVLEALGLTASDFSEANQRFNELGIVVSSKRVGRNSEPVITIKETDFGGFNSYGDGETWNTGKKSDLSAVKQWIK